VTAVTQRGGTLTVLLAAGGGTRYTGRSHKLLVPVAGRAVWRWSLDAAIAATIGPVAVVTGCVDLELPVGVTRLHNARWFEGLAGSLQLAVTNARDRDMGAVVVGLADQPCVGVDSWRRVADSTAVLAVATYDGERGNPVRIAAEAWPLLPRNGDEGARGVMRTNPHFVAEVPCDGSAVDLDTADDLARIERMLGAGREENADAP